MISSIKNKLQNRSRHHQSAVDLKLDNFQQMWEDSWYAMHRQNTTTQQISS